MCPFTAQAVMPEVRRCLGAALTTAREELSRTNMSAVICISPGISTCSHLLVVPAQLGSAGQIAGQTVLVVTLRLHLMILALVWVAARHLMECDAHHMRTPTTCGHQALSLTQQAY